MENPGHALYLYGREAFAGSKEVPANNRCKFIASFIVFSGFCPNKLRRLFSDNS